MSSHLQSIFGASHWSEHQTYWSMHTKYAYLAKHLLCGVGTFLCLLCLPLHAQDLERIGNDLKDPFKTLQISGGLDLTTNHYYSSDIDPRRDRFQWLVGANLNLSFMGVNAPFAFHFSDGNQQFNLPSYTFTGISPTYKWAQLHLGDRSLNYSRYTLNGVNFRGAGVELNPDKFYFSAMYGRLNRAVEEDLNSLQALDPLYRRMAWGGKVGYGDSQNNINLTLFSSADDENSITTPSLAAVYPSANTVLSLNGRKALGQRIFVDGEIANSSFNRDARAGSVENDGLQSIAASLGLFDPTSSATYGYAYNGNVNYVGQSFGIRLGYERIDRGFRNLGALFFNSDIENITAGFNTAFLNNRLTLMLNGGIERNNLSEEEKNSTERVIFSANATYVPSEIWMFNLSFSNFENTTKLRTLADPVTGVDSVFLAQLTQSAALSTTYKISEPGALTMMLSYQEASSITNDVINELAASEFINASLIYTHNLSDQALSFNGALHINQTSLAGMNTTMFSPSVGLNKGFKDRQIQTYIRGTYTQVMVDEAMSSQVINTSLGASYNFLNSHLLGADLSIINRSGRESAVSDFFETYGRLRYGYSF